MSQEPKSRSPRVEIKPEVWPALQVEAISRRMSPKDLVNMLIMDNLSPKAREFMESSPQDTANPETIATKEPMAPSPHDPMCSVVAVVDISHDAVNGNRLTINTNNKPKRKRLAKDQAAIETIKELWEQSPRPNKAEIARAIGYPATTTSDMIKRLKEKGKLE